MNWDAWLNGLVIAIGIGAVLGADFVGGAAWANRHYVTTTEPQYGRGYFWVEPLPGVKLEVKRTGNDVMIFASTNP